MRVYKKGCDALGEFRLKVNFSTFKKIFYILVALMCVVLAIFIEYRLYNNTYGEILTTALHILATVLAVLWLGIFVIIAMISKRTSLDLYQRGIKVKGRVEPIVYQDCSSFFFIPKSDNQVRGIAIKARYDTPVFSGGYLGEDFYKIVAKDFISENKESFIQRIDLGETLDFGIFSSSDINFLFFFRTKKIIESFTFKNKISIDNQGITYKGLVHTFSQINVSYDTKTGMVEIKQLGGVQLLLEHYTHFETGEMLFFLLEHYMKDSSTSKTKYLLSYDDTDSEVYDAQAKYLDMDIYETIQDEAGKVEEIQELDEADELHGVDETDESDELHQVDETGAEDITQTNNN